ncbi:DUF2382 domain-containing protein [Roseomonas sp. E05]|uniref:DUF2382 domain-containing protein n=1 Tax=Roseomonas sp. E05 TaxID=3046310 RepID=UPI0024BB8953|nr:DUF2382 domain-containing protein [Roseomonas sp. E05]MDJ0390495.1 DUF2382 domain-containing protein [Roseomonas sp. E05]
MPAETEPTVVPVVEEVLRASKTKRETGRVRVSIRTETVEDMVEARLRSRAASVERVAVGREVTEVPQIREEDGVLIVPVVEEVLVVERRLVLKEEIRLRQTESEETVQQPVARRVQHATIERLPAAQEEPTSPPSTNAP